MPKNSRTPPKWGLIEIISDFSGKIHCFLPFFPSFFRLFSYIMHMRKVYIIPMPDSWFFCKKRLSGGRSFSTALHRHLSDRITWKNEPFLHGGAPPVRNAAQSLQPHFLLARQRISFHLCFIFLSPLLYTFSVTCPVIFCDICVIFLTFFLLFTVSGTIGNKSAEKLIYQPFPALLNACYSIRNTVAKS